MINIADVINKGGKKYLPETDYVAQVVLCQVVSNNGKSRVRMALKIVDTLPEGKMDDIASSLKETEKFPGDERLWFDIFLPNENQKDGGRFCTEKLAEVLVAFGILQTDADGQLHFDAENELNSEIDLDSEPEAHWFEDRYVGIQVKKGHHFSNWDKKAKKVIDESKPMEDQIKRLMLLPEGE